MKCNNCGTINEEGIFFCCKCGESLKAQTAGQPQAEMKTCSSCGKQSPKTSSYCGYCGAKLPEEEDPENESSGPAPIYTLSMVDKYVGDIFIGISRSGGVLKVFNDRVEYHIKRSNMFGNALGKIGNTKKNRITFRDGRNIQIQRYTELLCFKLREQQVGHTFCNEKRHTLQVCLCC